ncbi:MAG TPA: heavy metal translocating P-type ATPase metal-binding domain-containing protein [Haliscomenobacter sp.]|uniref:heavy metal translocating P-type ATPase n=1 Tax=Haliscomenobacter sp. TaxID=2717303 RepID=UPI002CFE8BE2|nr:heavy metal translocating P-type ATPase metal-binding domain-containing protein [Haliscomenobacter sp.]HOY16301.1 heavy metal translocating P-type ATPase metal-binding domain-containing protein [Haliscomenobacter sp.]
MTASTTLKSNAGKVRVDNHTQCYHCSEPLPTIPIPFDEKSFCCEGCRTVYEILNTNGLCQYYAIDETAGISLRGKRREEYAFLDDPEVLKRLVQFSDGKTTRITLFLPQIHCASCIWLLENLYKLSDGVQSSQVNFLKRELHLVFSEEYTSLRKIAELLASLGYAPAINLGSLDEAARPVINRSFAYKIGVAGFAFGNIMLLSFPEYLGLDHLTESGFSKYFGLLNILLSLPVIFFSAQDYFRSAYQSLRRGELNIDVPLALGAAVLFLRSVYEILSHAGAGYMDSLAGLIFFLLIGKWFQQRTYHHISFERDYKSYFPISARKKVGQTEQSVALDKLDAGDIIFVRNGELIPADAIILRGEAKIDYSFVTGEAEPVNIPSGERVFAGGRQMGGVIELSLSKKVSQSYLTQLWNEDAFNKKQESQASVLANKVSRYFTTAILLIGFMTLIYWLPRNTSIAINAFTAVLIVACPCAGALAVPFTLGNALRILGRFHFFLKNTNAIEALYRVNTVVVDKTGTITAGQKSAVQFVGSPLSATEKQLIAALSGQSNHPASKLIHSELSKDNPEEIAIDYDVTEFRETIGKGVEATIGNRQIKLGARSFMDVLPTDSTIDGEGVYVQINNEVKGYFVLEHFLRPQAVETLQYLQSLGEVYLLSGDNDREAELLAPIFKDRANLHFRQSPKDKLQFIQELQNQGKKVLMLGDGLNDAGALRQADAGIAITEDTANFTPASDAILSAERFHRLPAYMEYARRSIHLVFGAYSLALLYNIVGLSFAVQGTLSPVVAAILMPLSSISIVIFGTISSNWLAAKVLKK